MTEAAITTDDVGMLRLDLKFRIGDTWSSEQWAVLVNGGPVNLGDPGWSVRAQCRDTDGALVAEWSTANDRVRLGTAVVTLDDDGPELTTSTVQLHHDPAAFDAPFEGRVECEITRHLVPDPESDPDPTAAPAENYTIAFGRCRASRDTSR